MTGSIREPNWKALFRSWDAQQQAGIAKREERFQTMFDVLEAQLPKQFTAIDLGAGTGALSLRLLKRFPEAKCVLVDYDPVTLEIARHALKDFKRGLEIVEADLRTNWISKLPRSSFDAVLSTTALHWLTSKELQKLCLQVAAILRRGGVFMNGDMIQWPARQKDLRRIAKSIRHKRYGDMKSSWTPWHQWWKKLESYAYFHPFLEIRKKRFPGEHNTHRPTTLDIQIDFLKRAGFRTVDVIWQDLENRILLGLK
jgi:SAM-dependent methyltransferase